MNPNDARPAPRGSGSFDYDWLIIGSGFGGSVAALRLAEKGYRVAVLECGRRFEDDDFAENSWQMRHYYWMPKLGLKGILRLTLFRDVFVASGCGVGGGSLGYANTLYRARPAFYTDHQWAELEDWEAELERWYQEAERMLGVTRYDEDTPADLLLKQYADEHGFGDTYAKTPVGVFLSEEGRTVPDPFFGGSGPARTGCVRCGQCMLGCRYGAKNTLVKNYLYVAERLGVQITPERTVLEIRPRGAADGSDGYVVTHERSGAWIRRERRQLTARGVVIAAGTLGTNKLLFSSKVRGSLPRVSDRLGHLVRTNSESILAVTAPDARRDFTRAVAITSSVHPDLDTHIEPVTYGAGGDSQSLLFWLLTEAGRRGTQPLHLALNIVRHPEGPTTGEGTADVGAVIFPPQLDIVDEHVRDAVARGATLLTGGRPRPGGGRFYEPTVLVDVDHTMKIMSEETFGPTLPIMKVSDVEEAIKLANDTPFGLQASVWTSDVKRGEELARRIDAGVVCVNDAQVNYTALNLPMGGWKSSGLGTRHGSGGIRKFTKVQSLLVTRHALKREPFIFPYRANRTLLLRRLVRLLYGRALRPRRAN